MKSLTPRPPARKRRGAAPARRSPPGRRRRPGRRAASSGPRPGTPNTAARSSRCSAPGRFQRVRHQGPISRMRFDSFRLRSRPQKTRQGWQRGTGIQKENTFFNLALYYGPFNFPSEHREDHEVEGAGGALQGGALRGPEEDLRNLPGWLRQGWLEIYYKVKIALITLIQRKGWKRTCAAG